MSGTSGAQGPWSEPVVIDIEATPTVVVRHENVTMGQLADIFDAAFGAIGRALGQAGVAPTGAAFARYEGDPTAEFSIEVGFPVAAELADAIDIDGHEVVPSSLPYGEVAVITHMGPYDQLSDVWRRLTEWAADQQWAPGQPWWEVYVTEPTPDTDPATLRTDLYLPVFPAP